MMTQGFKVLSIPLRSLRTLALVFVSAALLSSAASAAPPVYDHIVIVIEENESFSQIIGNTAQAPYINSLAQNGVVFTRMRGVTHPSQPNYFELFSGGNQGVTGDGNPPGPFPLSAPNLASALAATGRTFTAFSDGLPAAGDTTSDNLANGYVRRHCPWIWWIKPTTPRPANTLAPEVHQPFTAFPSDFNQLPTVSIVVPSNLHNMHDLGVPSGDTWLAQNLSAYAEWAKTHNSLLIVTWDEDNFGATNLIPTIFYGANLRQGVNGGSWTLHNLLRTIVDMYGLAQCGRSAEVRPIRGAFAGEVPVGSFIARPGLGILPRDTMLMQSTPNTSNATLTQIPVFTSATNTAQSLVRFDNIFGTNSGQLDNAATIVSAKMILGTLGGSVTGGNSTGTMRLHRMLAAWEDTSTWNSMNGGVSADGVEALAAAEATAVPNYYASSFSGGVSSVTFDATQSVQAWQGGAANRGWAVLTSSADTWIYGSIENPFANPALEISHEASAVAFTTPAVSIAEKGGVLTLTVTRTGNVAGALTVNYATSGAAQSGADYTSGSGTLAWSAFNVTPRQIQIPIVADSVVEGNETFRVTLTVTSGLGVVDSLNGATITILETPFNVWRNGKFGANANSPQAIETADPDYDGVNNLLEYAANTDPVSATTTGQPNIGGTEFLTITFLRNTGATDLIYTVRASGDLDTWLDGSTYSSTSSMPTNSVTTEISHSTGDPVETIVVRDNIPVAAAPARYLRLGVTRIEQ